MAWGVRWDNTIATLGVSHQLGFCYRFLSGFVEVVVVSLPIVVADLNITPIAVDALVLDLPHFLFEFLFHGLIVSLATS